MKARGRLDRMLLQIEGEQVIGDAEFKSEAVRVALLALEADAWRRGVVTGLILAAMVAIPAALVVGLAAVLW